MPYKKSYKRKSRPRNFRRRRISRPMKIGKPLRPKTYFFKRCLSETVQLNTQTIPSGWSSTGNALYRQFVYKLSDLIDYSDFTNMFNQYKLTGVNIQMFFSNTGSTPAANVVSTSAPQVINSNSQLLVWVAPNPTGQVSVVGPDAMLRIQSHKKMLALNGGRPLNIYKRLKQLSETHGGTSNTDFQVVTPKFISTVEPHCLHYGQSICIERADQLLMANNASNYQYCRFIYTYYIQCKQVQ